MSNKQINLQLEMRRLLAVCVLAGDDQNKFDYDNLDSGYCIDAPYVLPAGCHVKVTETALRPYPVPRYVARA